MRRKKLTPKRINELLRFLPLFEQPGLRIVERWHGGEERDGAITVPYPEYTGEVLEFFRRAGQPWWSDYDYKPREAAAMLADDNAIRSASLEQIKTLLTYCVRGERFCDGHWEAILQSGCVVAVLRRLRELAAGRGPEGGLAAHPPLG
jgi:hypothetical protein